MRKMGSVFVEPVSSPKSNGWMPSARVPCRMLRHFFGDWHGWFGYRVGMERAASVARVTVRLQRLGPLSRLTNISLERQSSGAEVEKRDREMRFDRQRWRARPAEVAKLQQEQKDLNDSLQKTQTERDQKVSEREALATTLISRRPSWRE